MSTSDVPYAVNRSNPTPIYRQIAEQLRQRIASGEFAQGLKLPSNRELAERYHVNHLTVRQALKRLEQDGLIEIAQGRGAFLPTPSPQAMRTALILPSLGHEQSGIIAESIRTEMGNEVQLHVMDYRHLAAEECACLQRLEDENYNSAIIFPSMEGEAVRMILRLIIEGFPLVVIDRSLGTVPASYVLSDNFTGGYLATRHLLERGCRRIACVTTDLPSADDRRCGYQQALAEFGIRVDRSLIIELPHCGDQTGDATTRLLNSQAVDGIFYYNDYQALVGIQQIKQLGRRVPDDIKVAGFDDLTIAQYADPTLTSIRQNYEAIGQEAVRLLLKQFGLPAPDRFTLNKILVPVELIVRNSS